MAATTTSFSLLMAVIMAVMPATSLACLPMDDVFEYSTLWMQAISVPQRHLLVIGQDSEKKFIRVRAEDDRLVEEYECLESNGRHRYMMKMTRPGHAASFECVKFIKLTPQVVRMARSSMFASRDKLDCQRMTYVEDQAVLIAYYDMPSQPCPLHGGFQMLIRQNESPDSDKCVHSGWNDNPSIHFECGQSNSSLVQFGRHCVPQVLKEAQKMRRRYLAHLNCVGSWEEPGKGKFALFQMRDMYTTFWCMNYDDRGSDPEVIPVYMTFDGRCSKKQQVGKSSDPSSRHGHLIRYIPLTDSRCQTEHEASSKCATFGGWLECAKTNICPHKCKRCMEKKKKTPLRTWFTLDAAGHWKDLGSGPTGLMVEVGQSNLTSSHQGHFELMGKEERDLPGLVYPVVRYGRYPSCMPFHACAHVNSPAAGLFNFFLRPAATEDGQIVSCLQTRRDFWDVVPIKPEQELTLVNREKMMKVRSCNLKKTAKYPTMTGKCQFVINKCSYNCTAFEVALDEQSCGDTRLMNQTETEHECLARLYFRGDHRAIVTRSVPSKRLLCWVFTSDGQLKLTPVRECNGDNLYWMLKFYNDNMKYDPLYALETSVTISKSSGGSYAPRILPSLINFIAPALLVLLNIIPFCA